MILATSTDLYPIGRLVAEIEHLAQLATLVLNEHVNDHGSCATCPGAAFPCIAAVLAEHGRGLCTNPA